jgi:hypothetical protein
VKPYAAIIATTGLATAVYGNLQMQEATDGIALGVGIVISAFGALMLIAGGLGALFL